MAQAIHGNRRSTAMEALLSRALEIGIQPEQNKNNAIVVTAQNRKKFPLVSKEGKVTEAGKYWYEVLNKVPAPTLFHYEQPLLWDAYVNSLMAHLSEFDNGARLVATGLLQHQDVSTSSTIVQNS